jgi:hypothetical protein
MSLEEKTTLQQLSEDVLKFPTNIVYVAPSSRFARRLMMHLLSEPLQFIWDGGFVTKHFTTYEFLRPISL